ncbi:hypothetical protein RFI_02565, partial [Reticulomyxa filosa]
NNNNDNDKKEELRVQRQKFLLEVRFVEACVNLDVTKVHRLLEYWTEQKWDAKLFEIISVVRVDNLAMHEFRLASLLWTLRHIPAVNDVLDVWKQFGFNQQIYVQSPKMKQTFEQSMSNELNDLQLSTDLLYHLFQVKASHMIIEAIMARCPSLSIFDKDALRNFHTRPFVPLLADHLLNNYSSFKLFLRVFLLRRQS